MPFRIGDRVACMGLEMMVVDFILRPGMRGLVVCATPDGGEAAFWERHLKLLARAVS